MDPGIRTEVTHRVVGGESWVVRLRVKMLWANKLGHTNLCYRTTVRRPMTVASAPALTW
jgi:hypothetical protein